MQKRYISDEELVAFLDGEDDYANVAEITSALKSDATLAKRIEDLRLDTSEISQSFGALKIGKMPELPSQPAANINYNSGIRNAIAASIIALVVGYGAGITTSNSQPDWRDYVAAYQALYTNSTLKNVALSEQAQQEELNRVAAAIGKTIEVDNLNVSSQVEYKRSQILGYEGKPLIQIAFLDSMGQPIALCIIRSDGNQKLELEMDSMEGMSSAKWSKSGYEYILIGGKDDALISRMASKFAETI